MPTRRAFIQAGLTISVAPAVPTWIHAESGSSIHRATVGHHPLQCVVCDMRSHWSTELANVLDRPGVTVIRTKGDITDFWFADLSQRWKRAPVVIAGLTADGPLFCLERLGWDHGLRVVFRGTHRIVSTDRIEHVITAPVGNVGSAHRAGLAGDAWVRTLAGLLSSCTSARETTATSVRGALGRMSDVDVSQLVSWVIAPKPA
jgi:hypothetical protein